VAAAHPAGFSASASSGGWLERSWNATTNLESQGDFLYRMVLEPILLGGHQLRGSAQ
jgi:hypothetical protein